MDQSEDKSMTSSGSTSSEPRYPLITVPMVGEDGNGAAVIARVRQALRRGGVGADEIKRFSEEATSGDYDNLLQTVMRWVDTE